MKAYAYVAALLAALGAVWGVYYVGGASARESYATAARDHLERQNALLAELETAKQTREVRYVDKIRVVRASTADCLSVPMLDADRLQLNGGAEAKPTPNP
jgi:hypothetical protein